MAFGGVIGSFIGTIISSALVGSGIGIPVGIALGTITVLPAIAKLLRSRRSSQSSYNSKGVNRHSVELPTYEIPQYNSDLNQNYSNNGNSHYEPPVNYEQPVSRPKRTSRRKTRIRISKFGEIFEE